MGWLSRRLTGVGAALLLAGEPLGVAAAEPKLADLSPDDRALLEQLDLLLELELLEAWDPGENLPIPLANPEAAAEVPLPEVER